MQRYGSFDSQSTEDSISCSIRKENCYKLFPCYGRSCISSDESLLQANQTRRDIEIMLDRHIDLHDALVLSDLQGTRASGPEI